MKVTTTDGTEIEVSDSNGDPENWTTLESGHKVIFVKTSDDTEQGPATEMVVMEEPASEEEPEVEAPVEE